MSLRMQFLGLTSALLILVGAGSRDLAAQAPSQAPYNILLVTPDQMRADYMHTYGYPSPNTPNIDKLGAEGTDFVRAYDSGPWTTPSFGAIHTGLFPTVHGMTLTPYHGCGSEIMTPMVTGGLPTVPDIVNLSKSKTTLAEYMKRLGMVTAADNANCFSFFDIVNRGWDSFQFFRGRQHFLPEPSHPDSYDSYYLSAPHTLPWAQQWLKEHYRERFFFWVHFMEPHSPYNPPREYDRFKTADDYPNVYDDNKPDADYLQSRARLGDIHAIRRLQQLYAAKISYSDHYIGELLKTVHDLGLDGNTIVILVSDHGQLMYSHPEDYNSDEHMSLYDADQHVPLIFRGPGIPAGRRVEALASHYDLLPTILDLENAPPPSRTDGKSLKGVLMEGAAPPHEYLYGEQSAVEPLYSIRDPRYKLIESLRSGRIQCFDNLVDPDEKHDICGDIPVKAAEMKRGLDLHIQTMIAEAKSYPEWENNLALAVIEQRDSKGLLASAPRNITVAPNDAEFQLNPGGWSLSTAPGKCAAYTYWAPAGPATASVIWRVDEPLLGDYDVSVCYGGADQTVQRFATNSSFVVRFRGGSLSIPVDQNQKQGEWTRLGRFSNPISVELTNRADGPVAAGAARFVRIGADDAEK